MHDNLQAIVNIGITGHRHIPDEHASELRQKVHEILELIQEHSQSVLTRFQRLYHPFVGERTHIKCVLLSSLAEGADILAANCAQKLGYEIAGILPKPYEDYKKTFDSAELQQEMWRLYESAGRQLSIDNDPKGSSYGYMSASDIMLCHSDILIALWDGEKTKFIAGTYATIQQAQEKKVPVIHVDINDPSEVRMIYKGRHRDDWKECLTEALNERLLPHPDASEDDQLLLLGNILPVIAPRRTPKLSLDSMMENFILHPLSFFLVFFKKKKGRSSQRQELHSLAKSISQTHWEKVKKSFSDASRGYAGLYRNSLLLRFILPVLAVIFLILALNISNYGIDILFSHVFSLSVNSAKQIIASILYTSQIIALFSVIFLVRRSKKTQNQLRYGFYRVFAEHCRVNMFLWPMGFARTLPQEGAMSWYTRLIIRNFGLPSIDIRKEDIREWLMWLKKDLLSSQLGYHEKRLNRYMQLQRILGTFSMWCFILSLTAAVLRAISASVNAGGSEILPKGIESVAGGFALLLPALASFWSSYSNNAGYPSHSAASSSMVNTFSFLSREVDELLGKDDLAYTDVMEMCDKLHTKCMEELNEWESGLQNRKLKYF